MAVPAGGYLMCSSAISRKVWLRGSSKGETRMPTMDQIQPYTPLIVMAVKGLIAGWLAGLVFGGRGRIHNLLRGNNGSLRGRAPVGHVQVSTVPPLPSRTLHR